MSAISAVRIDIAASDMTHCLPQPCILDVAWQGWIYPTAQVDDDMYLISDLLHALHIAGFVLLCRICDAMQIQCEKTLCDATATEIASASSWASAHAAGLLNNQADPTHRHTQITMTAKLHPCAKAVQCSHTVPTKALWQH